MICPVTIQSIFRKYKINIRGEIVITTDNYEIVVLENLIDSVRSALNEIVCYSDKDEYSESILYISQVLDKLILEYAEKTYPFLNKKGISSNCS